MKWYDRDWFWCGFAWGQIVLSVVILLLLTGCASALRPGEVAFHVLNAADMAQSVNGISRDCFREVDWLTSRVLGDEPSATDYALFGAAVSLGFHALNRTEYLQERPRLRLAFNALAIAAKGWQVARNHDAGMRPFGDNPGCRIGGEPWTK